MPKRKYALYDSDKECTKHSWQWSGEIPCTGVYRCILCGMTYDEYKRSQAKRGRSPAKRKNVHEIMGRVASQQITKPTLLYRDQAGNTLWCKFIKCRGIIQVFGRTAEGKLVGEQGVAVLMEESGHNDPRNGYMVTPESDRARRMMDHGANHQARGRR